MPAAITSLSELLADVLHGSATPPAAHWGLRQRRSEAVSFYNVNCHEGFKCISKVDTFGRIHDGAFTDANENKAVKFDFRGTYEEGCPAKGKVNSVGECKDDENGQGVSMCWTNQRYEAGKDGPCHEAGACECVKATENGERTLNKKLAVDKTGTEKVMQSYLVQVPMNCDSCEAYSRNPSDCKACSRCVFTEKEISGRMVEGCYEADPFKPKPLPEEDEEPGREYLEGTSTSEEPRIVLPHYKLWDPGDKNGDEGYEDISYKFPFQSRSEPLSHDTWLEKYALAAPRMQRLMDRMAAKVKRFSPDPSTHKCRTESLGCMDNIGNRLEQVRSVQRACRAMQAMEMKLRKGKATPFEAKAPDGQGGNMPINCKVGSGGMCQRLNCYSANLSDQGIPLNKGALVCMREKLKSCLPEIRAADMKQKNIDNGLEDERTDADLDETPPEPMPKLHKKRNHPPHGPGQPPPEPGQKQPPPEPNPNDPVAMGQAMKGDEDSPERAPTSEQEAAYDQAVEAEKQMPKQQFDAAEKQAEHDPRALEVAKAEQRLMEGDNHGGEPEPSAQALKEEEAAEKAVKEMDREAGPGTLEHEAEVISKTNPETVVREQKSMELLDQLEHDPNKAAERRAAGLTPESMEGSVEGAVTFGLAMWTAVGVLATSKRNDTKYQHRNQTKRGSLESRTLEEFLFPPNI